jgi:hypothetical protein
MEGMKGMDADIMAKENVVQTEQTGANALAHTEA